MQMGTDHETRKRRARQEAEEDSDDADDEDDKLVGLIRVAEGDSDDGDLDEHDKQQLLHAHALKGNVSNAVHIHMARSFCYYSVLSSAALRSCLQWMTWPVSAH